MRTKIFIVFLVVLLAACAQTSKKDVQSTALAIAQTGVALTQTALPTVTPPPPTLTPTETVVYPTPSPIPTFPPPPILTPDAIQVERWKEYQTELAKAVLSGYDSALFPYALCEWDILGRSGQEMYVWAYCAIRGGAGASKPAVITLNIDGTIKIVRIAGYKGSSYDLGLFPVDVQEKCVLYTGDSLFRGRIKEMINHIDYRELHSGEPPLIVLLAMLTPIIVPTP